MGLYGTFLDEPFERTRYEVFRRFDAYIERLSRFRREFLGAAEIGMARAAALAKLLKPARERTLPVPQVYYTCHTNHRKRLIHQPPGRFPFYQGEW